VSIREEQSFWSRVWQCAHRHPCKRCCWPWLRSLVRPLTFSTWQAHPVFIHPILTGGQQIGAYRLAYILCHGALLFPRIITICHQCHFGPCCNPAHLRAGTQSDNARDHRGKYHYGRGYPPVRLPDGRVVYATSS
jgi:hypothetical protein